MLYYLAHLVRKHQNVCKREGGVVGPGVAPSDLEGVPGAGRVQHASGVSTSYTSCEGLILSQLVHSPDACCSQDLPWQNLFGFCKHSITSEWQLHHACAGMVDASDTPKSGVARLTQGHK